MKRRITLSLVLTLSVLLSLVSLPSTAQAAPPRFRADSGFVSLSGPQILRITVNGTGGNDTIRVRLRWMQYGAQTCSGMPAVCRHMVVAQGTTAVETLGADDALSFDLPGMGDGSRVVVEANSPNVRVLGVVFDTSTQRINAICTFIPD
ncbi:MAG: hypothetical protein ABI596_07280 [Pyrinomonadaceae bacterium]